MTPDVLKAVWKKEEDCARIIGWDFSHIHGRYAEEQALPWDYAAEIRGVLRQHRIIPVCGLRSRFFRQIVQI